MKITTITKKSFSQLTKTEKVVMVMKSGNEIMTRKTKNNLVHLYSLSGLLIEIWYNKSKSAITKVLVTNDDLVVENYSRISDIIEDRLKHKILYRR